MTLELQNLPKFNMPDTMTIASWEFPKNLQKMYS